MRQLSSMAILGIVFFAPTTFASVVDMDHFTTSSDTDDLALNTNRLMQPIGDGVSSDHHPENVLQQNLVAMGATPDLEQRYQIGSQRTKIQTTDIELDMFIPDFIPPDSHPALGEGLMMYTTASSATLTKPDLTREALVLVAR